MFNHVIIKFYSFISDVDRATFGVTLELGKTICRHKVN